jgi:cobalt/nickel transport system permease protein
MTLPLNIPAPEPSPLQRLDPRWRLAAVLCGTCGVVLLQSPLPALTALAAALMLVLLARVPLRWVGVRLLTALILPAFFVLWLPFAIQPGHAVWDVGEVAISATGLANAVTLLAKAACVVTLMLVLMATAPMHETFKAAQSLRIPGWLVHLALLSYRYVFLLGDEFGRLRTALRVRGYRNRASLHSYRTIGQVAGTLLVRGHERSERVAQAMRCRGFDGHFRSLHDFQTRGADVLFFAATIVIAGGLLAWDLWDRYGDRVTG